MLCVPARHFQFSNTASKSTFFVLYLSSLLSFTIPVKKKIITVYVLLAHPVYVDEMSEDVLATQDGESHVVLCYTIFLYKLFLKIIPTVTFCVKMKLLSTRDCGADYPLVRICSHDLSVVDVDFI